VNSGRPTVVVATDPDGALHVLASSVRSGTARAGLVDLGARSASSGALGDLFAPIRLGSAEDLFDFLAHLAPLRAPHAALAGDEAELDVVVRHVTRGAALPAHLSAPLGRRLVLHSSGPPAELDGRALLFASARAPGGPWWAPIGDVPFEVLALGALLGAAGLFGPGARTTASTPFAEHAGPWLADVGAGLAEPERAFAAALSEALLVEPSGAGVAGALRGRTVEADDGARVVVTRTGHDGPAFEWPCARWFAPAIDDIGVASSDALAPYRFLLFDGPRGHPPVLTRAVGARRWIASRDDLRAVEAHAPQPAVEEPSR
jgi:hypothetical protein